MLHPLYQYTVLYCVSDTSTQVCVLYLFLPVHRYISCVTWANPRVVYYVGCTSTWVCVLCILHQYIDWSYCISFASAQVRVLCLLGQ